MTIKEMTNEDLINRYTNSVVDCSQNRMDLHKYYKEKQEGRAELLRRLVFLDRIIVINRRYVVDATMDNIEFGELIRKEIKDFQSQHNTLDKKEKTND